MKTINEHTCVAAILGLMAAPCSPQSGPAGPLIGDMAHDIRALETPAVEDGLPGDCEAHFARCRRRRLTFSAPTGPHEVTGGSPCLRCRAACVSRARAGHVQPWPTRPLPPGRIPCDYRTAEERAQDRARGLP